MKNLMASIVALLSTSCLAQSFEEEMAATRATYSAPRAETEQLALDRRFGEIADLWLQQVPEDERTAADYFLLGNMLFGPQPERALVFHRKAAELRPDELQLQLELGMSLHRNKKYAEAIAPYKKYLKEHPSSLINALLADCLIHQGSHREAVSAWNSTDFSADRVRIAHYIFEIHGDPSVYQRHYDSLIAARNGDIRSAAETILLDVQWDDNWWNTEVNSDFLATDIEEFGKLFPKENPTLQAMRSVSSWYLSNQDDVRPLEESLRNANILLGNSAILPRPGLLASNLIGILLSEDVVTAEQLMAQFSPEFEKELELPGEQIDVELINIYANLLNRTDEREKLKSVSRTVWKKVGDARFAASYLVSLIGDKKGLNDPEVEAIVKQFPQHEVVSAVALDLAKSEKRPLVPYLTNAIAAEYQQLSIPPIGVARTADRLNHLFRELAKVIDE